MFPEFMRSVSHFRHLLAQLKAVSSFCLKVHTNFEDNLTLWTTLNSDHACTGGAVAGLLEAAAADVL